MQESKYFYNSIHLKDYADKNDLNESLIHCAILRKTKIIISKLI